MPENCALGTTETEVRLKVTAKCWVSNYMRFDLDCDLKGIIFNKDEKRMLKGAASIKDVTYRVKSIEIERTEGAAWEDVLKQFEAVLQVVATRLGPVRLVKLVEETLCIEPS